MKINKFAVLIGIFSFLCVAANFTHAATTEDVTLKAKKIYLEPEKSVLEKGKTNFILAVTSGYDNNTHLDSQRDGDAFAQTYFKAAFLSPLSEKTDLKLDYEMMNLIYAGERDLDLSKNAVRLGVDHKLTEDLTFSTGYGLDSIAYWHAKGQDPREGDYIENALDFELNQKLGNKLYHSVAYKPLIRSYGESNIRDEFAVNTDKERQDWRHILGYEIGKYFQKDLVKVGLEYYNNNSNETYLKYYDYNSYKLGSSLTHLFNKAFSGYLAWSWQYRDYKSRTLINDVNKTQFEKTFLGTAAVFYSLNKSLSFGLNYTYRQNSSNEPIDRYSGSLISLSTYYKF